MVIQERKLRKYVSIEMATRLYRESKDEKDFNRKLKSLTARQKAPPPPEGGISIREAARKYELSSTTLSRWVRQGKINILSRTPNWLYIKEADLAEYLRMNGNNGDN